MPAHVDLRSHDWMPVDVKRLLGSDTWVEAADDPKLGHVLMSLWAASWHQIPAGSLPTKEATLARMAFCDATTWERYRDRALRAWVLCSDGRLYHPVVAEKAIESWAWKQKKRHQTSAATAAAAEAARLRRQSVTDSVTDPNVQHSNVPQRTSTDQQRSPAAAPQVVDKTEPPKGKDRWAVFFQQRGYDLKTVNTAKLLSAFGTWVEAGVTLEQVEQAIAIGDQKLGTKASSPAYYLPIVAELIVRGSSALTNANPPRSVDVNVYAENATGARERLGTYQGTIPGASAIDAAVQAVRQYHRRIDVVKAKSLFVEIDGTTTPFSVDEAKAESAARYAKERDASASNVAKA